MTQNDMASAVTLLAAARREGVQIEALNLSPASVDIGHAIQDQVAAALGEPVGGFKANAPPGGVAIRGAIFSRAILPSPAQIPAAQMPDLGVEGEIAFRFTCDLPPRAADYSREEIAAAVTALPAIELVSSRLRDWQSQPALDQLADCLNNGGLVPGAELAEWNSLEIANLQVTAWVNGEEKLEQTGGHPIGDPLAVAVGLANIQRRLDGVKAGQIVTTGSCTGIMFLQPGDSFAVEFEGLGRAEVEYT